MGKAEWTFDERLGLVWREGDLIAEAVTFGEGSLIASAPAMYNLLRCALDNWLSGGPWVLSSSDVQEVLAKADGEN